MEKVINWLNINKLSQNLKKTHYIIFRKQREKIWLNKDIIINKVRIELTEKTKFLGVIIDQYLSFFHHIQYIKGKVARALGILYKCRKYFNSNTLLTLYNAFVYPYYNYCISVWGNTYTTYLDPLAKLQKRAIRIIASTDRLAHTAPLFKTYNVLSLHKIYVYSVQLFLFNYYNDNLPQIFSSFYKRNNEIHDHSTRQYNLFHVPCKRSFQASRSIRCSGVIIYNYFFGRLSMLSSFVEYKKELKKYLLMNEAPNTFH